MNLTIGEKDYDLQFGLKFINTIDNTYKQSMNGIEFGMGLEMATTYLSLGRPTALANIIKAATSHLNSKPSNKNIESFLEYLVANDPDEYEKLFDDIQESMEQAPFLKHHMKKMKNIEK